MKRKMFETPKPKDKKNVIHIVVDPLSRNELHFEVQRRTRVHVFDDRRKRKPKHKGKLEDF